GAEVSRSSLAVVVCLAALAAAPARAAEGAPPDKVSFYFAAHADDWQLFMNPSAFEDVAGGAAKTGFVHVTAGAAGPARRPRGAGTGGRQRPYYLARENGAASAIRFMAEADAAPMRETAARTTFNGHSVHRASYGSTVSYFLRLPDGHPSGAGYGGTGWQSLPRLGEDQIGARAAIDHSAEHPGWAGLVGTWRRIT